MTQRQHLTVFSLGLVLRPFSMDGWHGPRLRGHAGDSPGLMPTRAWACHPTRPFIRVAALACLLGSAQVFAQRPTYDAGAVSSVDAYGNARPVGLNRRPVFMFQNDVQRQALRSYQDDARRLDRRGGTMVFALGADALQLNRARRAQLLAAGTFSTGGRSDLLASSTLGSVYKMPVARSERSRTLAQIYSRYGGFGRRVGAGPNDDVSSVFSRKYELLQATALTAPVHRANMLRGGVSGRVLQGVTGEPMIAVRQEPVAVDRASLEGGVGLDVTLMATLDRQYDTVLARAWAFFKKTNYQQAVRAFESASVIQEDAIEPRVGEMYCYVALGAMRTAMVSLRSFSRHVGDPFEASIDVRERFSNDVERRRVTLQTQLTMQASSKSEYFAPVALHALVLWYLGERKEAVRVAQRLISDEVPMSLRSWPALMLKSALPGP